VPGGFHIFSKMMQMRFLAIFLVCILGGSQAEEVSLQAVLKFQVVFVLFARFFRWAISTQCKCQSTTQSCAKIVGLSLLQSWSPITRNLSNGLISILSPLEIQL
jgi:hypothetical protein